MMTLQSFRIFSQNQTPFISLNENIDYSTPEGVLQLTIFAAFAAFFSDMLAKHISEGQERELHKDFTMVTCPLGRHWFSGMLSMSTLSISGRLNRIGTLLMIITTV